MHRPGTCMSSTLQDVKPWSTVAKALLPTSCQGRTPDRERETGMSANRNYQRSLYQCTHIKCPLQGRKYLPCPSDPSPVSSQPWITGIRTERNAMVQQHHCKREHGKLFPLPPLLDKPKQEIHLSFKKNKSNPTKKLLALTQYQFLIFCHISLETRKKNKEAGTARTHPSTTAPV